MLLELGQEESQAVPNMELKLTKEPATRIAHAIRATEPIASLTWC